jgi:phosphoenolpyruvate carboxylase
LHSTGTFQQQQHHVASSIQGLEHRCFSSYSSFREPGSLFELYGSQDPMTSNTTTNLPTFSISQALADRDATLRADVRTMGSLLGGIIQDHHGGAVFEKIEEMRGLAKQWREAGAGRNPDTKDEAAATFEELVNLCSKLSNEELHIIARAFTHFLAIANAAEGHHRGRLLSMAEYEGDALPKKSDSCGGVLQNLMTEGGHDADTIYDCLTSQCVELVLTAHPTEVNRRTILWKQRRVQEVCELVPSLS